jgi:uncharacterized membrane protein
MSYLGNRRHARDDPPPPLDVNAEMEARATPGQRAADWVAATMGSWRFILVQSAILLAWVVLNVAGWIGHWDPYPFILMNLVLSMQAAFAAPIIMMSQNRQAQRDRLEAHRDLVTDTKAEEEIREMMERLAEQEAMLRRILACVDPPSGRMPHTWSAADPHAPQDGGDGGDGPGPGSLAQRGSSFP